MSVQSGRRELPPARAAERRKAAERSAPPAPQPGAAPSAADGEAGADAAPGDTGSTTTAGTDPATRPAPPAGTGTAPSDAPGAPDTADPARTADPASAADPARAAKAAEAADAAVARVAAARSEGTPDARALTRILFDHLAALTPGTPGHERVRAALIELNLPLVRYAATRFRSRSEPMDDVLQVGTIGLINAIDRFDPARGVQFPTYAVPTVVGEIKRYFRDNVRGLHVPRRLQELWIQVSAATEDLTAALGRSPTVAEIAQRLRLPERDVIACLEVGRAYQPASIEGAADGDGGGGGLLDRLGYEDTALTEVEHRDMVRYLLVQLPERERSILLMRFFGDMTQSQISDVLGLSQMHVSRLLSRSLARLRSANADQR